MDQAETEAKAARDAEVICVDLDGTVLHTDTLAELALKNIRKSPLVLLRMMAWIFAGKARLKHELACRVSLSVEQLPYNAPLIEYLRKLRQAGCYVVMATAAPEAVARAIADHLDLFDEVWASTRDLNLKGKAKADLLVQRFGDKRFVYAGNDHSDRAIWAHASRAVVVGNPSALGTDIGAPVEKIFLPDVRPISEFFRALRLHQWVKNFLVFLPVIASGSVFDVSVILNSMMAFVCFGATASAVYLCNDLVDLDTDRRHVRKRHRPFASGSLPLLTGIVAAPVLASLALAGATFVDGTLALILVGYLVVSTAYSFWLKRLPLVDVFALAMLYATRVLAGGVVTGISPSIWLLSFICFFFLSLAFLKRQVEVGKQQYVSPSPVSGRGYNTQELVPLTVMGISSGFASALVLALYVNSAVASNVYSRQWLVWALVPLCLFWLNRMWLSGWRGYVDDDPIVYAAKDWVSWVTAVVGALFYLAAI